MVASNSLQKSTGKARGLLLNEKKESFTGGSPQKTKETEGILL